MYALIAITFDRRLNARSFVLNSKTLNFVTFSAAFWVDFLPIYPAQQFMLYIENMLPYSLKHEYCRSVHSSERKTAFLSVIYILNRMKTPNDECIFDQQAYFGAHLVRQRARNARIGLNHTMQYSLVKWPWSIHWTASRLNFTRRKKSIFFVAVTF